MNNHILKIHKQPFDDLLSGAKTAEVRNNDRGFKFGDTVQLLEIAGHPTGRVMHRHITHVQAGYGLPDGLCVLSYAPLIAESKAGQGEVALPPFAKKVIEKLRRFEECADDGQGADIGRHWFDILTRLGLLNRVQRSAVEVTQQGDDLLTCTAPPATGVIVPIEPTRAMWAAAGDAVTALQHEGVSHHDKLASAVWLAMLAAAQKAKS